jgi:hypothetical protein
MSFHRHIPWLSISDSDSNLPEFLFINPDTFVPKPSTTCGGACLEWGINQSDENDENAALAPMIRKMQTQFFYMGDTPTPEKQYIKLLMDKKAAALKKNLALRKPLFSQDFVLKIEAIIQSENLRPLTPMPVWRTVVVSGGMNLRQFQDRVLTPAMGFARNYHGYLFTDPTDGALFGPVNSNSIDMMHIDNNGYDSMPDTKTKIAELMQQPGAFMLYVYDLGDHWYHKITLESVNSLEESTGAVKLLAGEGMCPPEDSNGLDGMGSFPFEELCRMKRGKKFREACNAASASMNYDSIGLVFDPDSPFDLDFHRRAVAEAVGSAASVLGGEKVIETTMPMWPGGGSDMMGSMMGNRPGTKTNTTAVAGSCDHVKMREQVRTGCDPRLESVCAVCGSPNNIMKCGRCKIVKYCGQVPTILNVYNY